MTPTFWQISAWTIAIALSYIIVFEMRRSKEHNLSALTEQLSHIELGLALSLIAIGLVLRLAFLNEFEAGRLTSDENWIAVGYVSKIVHGEPVRGGATQLAFARALDIWYQSVGFTPLLARAFSATLGVISLVAFYAGLRKVSSNRLALWSTAFLSTSLFGIYFSKLALETGWAIFVPPVMFLLFISGRSIRPILATVSGIVFSLGIFSYPGLLMAAAAVAAGTAISFIIRDRTYPERHKRPSRQFWILMLAFAAGTIPFTAYALYQHSAIYGGGHVMTGGGTFTFVLAPLLTGLIQVLKDALINADSWYMPYRDTPFFEITLLPLAVFGILMFWRARWPWYTLGVFIGIPICIAMVPFTGPYPGMRRALFVLLPYYVAVGGGMIFLLSALNKNHPIESSIHRPLASPYKLFALIILFLSVAQPVLYQLTTGRDNTRWNFGEGFAKRIIPYDLILTSLKTHDVVLDQDEFKGYFDDLIYPNFFQLYARYTPDAGIQHSLLVLPTTSFFQSNNGIAKLSNKILMTWDAQVFGQLVSSGKICIEPESMSADKASYPYRGLVSTSDENNCRNSIKSPTNPGQNMSMAFDRLTRLKHQLHCDASICGPDRPDFVYTKKDVSFILTPKLRDKKSILRLKIANPAPDRQSIIFVNNVFIGTLNQTSLNKSLEYADFVVPIQATSAPDNWLIRIGPSPTQPDKLGWDIVAASLLDEDTATQDSEKYRRVYSYTELGKVRQPGTKWDDGTFILDSQGITVSIKRPMTASLLDMSFDNNDVYSVLFYNQKTLITTLNVKGSHQADGLEKRIISLPHILKEKSFNNIQIVPISGDGYYSIGHFILK